MTVVTEKIEEMVLKAQKALSVMTGLSQIQVDAITAAMCEAGVENAARLAEMAVQETGMGNVQDKTIKNNFTSQSIYEFLRDKKSVSVIDDENGIKSIAEPFGVIAALAPVTNPTATVYFKSMNAMKTRNVLIFAFHPRAQKCSAAAAMVMRDAAVLAGAPQDCIQWIENPSIETTNALMKHPGISLIVATGGGAMVKAAYSSGHPAYGVGPGNVPAYVEKTADLNQAVTDIITSKTFDYGVACTAEQCAIFDDRDTADKALQIFMENGAYICSAEERAKLEKIMFDKEKGVPAAAIIGQSPQKIAELAGFSVPSSVKVLMVEAKAMGPADWMSHEKLSPVLAWYVADGKDKAIQAAIDQLEFGGAGHNSVIHSKDEAIVEEYALKVPSSRVIWNQPSLFGAVGFTSNMPPTFTVGCGARGGNIITDGLNYKHFINVKRLIKRARANP